ncbi:MAG TPA: hypothetical protein VFT71_04055, partial [Candidatus Nitrosocosmicus sp.]|nr:hypothetical protein [Candidatus Nitrosocosmicus sp.]
MTNTKSFSTKNAGILIVAIFSIAISMGLSQVTSAMAQTDIVDCSPEVDDESIDNEIKNTRSCVDEDEDEEKESEASNSVKTPSQNVVRTAPASADP